MLYFCMIMDVFTSNLMNLWYLTLSLNVINVVRVLFAKVILKIPSVPVNDGY